jgi:hypothetical protein
MSILKEIVNKYMWLTIKSSLKIKKLNNRNAQTWIKN